MKRLRVVTAAVLVCAGSGAGQEQQFCIAGKVVNSVTGEPVRRALVNVAGTKLPAEAVQHAALSADGSFRFCGLPGGVYFLSAAKPGFENEDDAPGQAAWQRPVQLGPSREDAVVRLQPMATVRGKITDANGQPVGGVRVEVWRARVESGRRYTSLAHWWTTNDLGEYAMRKLSPGRHYIRVAGRGGAPYLYVGQGGPRFDSGEAIAPVYFGGASSMRRATPLRLAAGSELRADFTLTPRPGYRVGGVVTNLVANTADIELIGADDERTVHTVSLNRDTGKFEISGVVPGSYTLRVTEKRETGGKRQGEAPVVVADADVSDVKVALSDPVNVDIQIRDINQPATGEKQLLRWNALLEPVEAGEPSYYGKRIADGTFRFPDVAAGKYTVRFEPRAGYVDSALWGDRDLMANNEITIRPGAAVPRLEFVVGADGATVAAQIQPARPGEIFLVAEDGNPFHVYRCQAEQDGGCELRNVAPGSYRAVAIPLGQEFEYTNSEAAGAAARRGAAVRVAARGHERITVTLAGEETK